MRAGVVLSLSFGFLLGVVLFSVVELAVYFLWFTLLISGAFLLLLFLFRKAERSRNFYLFTCVFFCALSLGGLRTLDSGVQKEPLLESLLEQRVSLEGLLTEEPEQRLNGTLFVLEVDTLGMRGRVEKVAARVRISAERAYGLRYGERVRVEGVLLRPEAFRTETGRVFDYQGYLSARGIFYTMIHPKVEILSSGGGNRLLTFLYFARRNFVEALSRTLSEPEATLLSGLLLGSQRELPKEVEDSFRQAGLSHIVVLSGYNITLVAEACMRLLSFLPLTTRLWGASFSIVLFVLAVGAGTSAVRAGLMALLVLLARGTGRTYLAGEALLFTGVIMVFLDPRILLGDVSFQLSFLATLGLIYATPILEVWSSRLPEWAGLKMLALSTLATQVFVLPLILYNSGLLSLVALPANLSVLPAVPPAMFLGALLGVLSLVSAILAWPLSLVVYAILHYQISAANFFAALPFASLILPEFPLSLMLLVYALGVIFLYFHYVGRAKSEPRAGASPPGSS